MPDKANRPAIIATPFRQWLMLFVPLFAAIIVTNAWLGLRIVLPILIGLMIAALIYRRVVRGRSWRSMMWGVHASDE